MLSVKEESSRHHIAPLYLQILRLVSHGPRTYRSNLGTNDVGRSYFLPADPMGNLVLAKKFFGATPL